MKQKTLTLDQLKTKIKKEKPEKPNDLEIPGVEKIDEFLQTLDPPDRKEFMQKVKEKAIGDLLPDNRKAIIDTRLRTEIIEATQLVVDNLCIICTSMYAPMYNEWLTKDRRSPEECSRLARSIFIEDIPEKKFKKHAKYHIHDLDLVRKSMILVGPTVNPKNVATGLLQLLAEDIIKDEDLNLKKIKTAKELVKAITDIEKIQVRAGPVVDARSINITNINEPGNIPIANDTRETLTKQLTPEKMARLRELQETWGNRGSSKIRLEIPEEPPVVKKKESTIIEGFISED